MIRTIFVSILLFAFSSPVFAADKFVAMATSSNMKAWPYNYNNINSLKNLRTAACGIAEDLAGLAGEAGKPTRSETAMFTATGEGNFRVTCTVVKGDKK